MFKRHHVFTMATVALCGVTILVSTTGVGEANTAPSTVQPATSLAHGLVDRTLATVNSPTDIAFTPDGRALITTNAGRLRVMVAGQLVPGAALDLSQRICSGTERGLLGVAVDPSFATNQRIYLFWTHDTDGKCAEIPNATPVNRVSRYRLGADNDVVPGSVRLIVDNIPSPTNNHNAGDLAFGSDGMLYITTGDGSCEIGSELECGADNDNSRRLDIPNGKVLRVTPTGAVPNDNPFAADLTARRCTAPGGPEPGAGPCSETFAWGFRNPFRMSIKPGTSTPWVDDVGQNTWEEIDQVVAGNDYGWNIREGYCATGSTTDCSPAGYTDPEFSYDRTTGCTSITGSSFVPEGTWHGRFAGDLMFADFICGSIFRLHDAGGTFVAKPLAPAASPVSLAFGPSPDGRALYYLSYNGEIHAIADH
jgi:glucose/arabinose dehydrogenase